MLYVIDYIFYSIYDLFCKDLPRCPCFGNWKGHPDAVISGSREAAESARPSWAVQREDVAIYNTC